MIKKFSLLLLGFLFIGKMYAQKSMKTKPIAYVNINIDLAYKDKTGNDLLDSANAIHFAAKDITI